MKIINSSYQILTEIDSRKMLKNIERAGRTCYKSEKESSWEETLSFVKSLIDKGHESVIEHENISIKFICDRGISHEIVRHRIASYSQESTRYCNYSKEKYTKEITVILPLWYDLKVGDRIFDDTIQNRYNNWVKSCEEAEKAYMEMLAWGASTQEARNVLPTSLKTEIIMTTNLREWRHFFRLRTAQAAHPQMRQLTIPLLKELKEKIPIIFDDIS